MPTLFSGLAAFPLTPTDAAGVVDVDALSLLADRLADAKVASAATGG